MSYSRATTVDSTQGGDSGKQAVLDLDTDVTNIFAHLNTHEALTITHGATGAIVGTTNTQTLTLKTLTTPVIASMYQDAGKTKLMSLPNTASDTFTTNAATQTLTNKTLTAPTIADLTNANHAHTTAALGGFALPGGPSYSQADGTTIAVDWANGATQYVTIAATGRTVTFANPVEGQTYNLIVIQGSGGSKTITTWPTIKWSGGSAPTLTTTAAQADIMTFKYCNSIYYGSCTKNF